MCRVEGVTTNFRRMQFEMSHSNLCPSCVELEETLFRLFRDCSDSKLVWQFFIRIDARGNSIQLQIGFRG